MKETIKKSKKLYIDAYSHHPKEIWALFVLTIINRSGTMVIPFLSVYLTTVLDFTFLEAGFLLSAFGFGSLGGAYFGGKLSDRIGANFVIIYSLIFSGFLLISLQFATHFYSIFILIFITSLFGEAYRPAVMALAGEFVSKSQTARTMSLIRLAINLGMAAGPLVGGFIAVSISYSGLFWIDGLTCISAAVYFWFESRNWHVHKQDRKKNRDTSERQHTPAPYKNKKYLLFIFATFLMGFCFIQWFHTIPVFLKTDWGYDERYIGLLLMINALIIAFIEMPIIHIIEHAGRIKGATLTGLTLTGLSFLPFLISPAFAIGIIAMLLMTFGELLFLPLNSSIALNKSPLPRRGDYIAMYWMSWSLTNILGPSLGFIVIDKFGFSFLWILCSILIVVSFVINLWITRRWLD